MHLPLLQFYWKYFGVEPINGRWKINLTKQKPRIRYVQMSIGPIIIVRDVQWTLFLGRILLPFQLMRIIQRKRMFLPDPICRRLCFGGTMHVQRGERQTAAVLQRTLCGVVLHCQWSCVIDFIVVIVHSFIVCHWRFGTSNSVRISYTGLTIVIRLNRSRSNAHVFIDSQECSMADD